MVKMTKEVRNATYHYFFSKVLAKRFKFVNNIICILSFLLSEILAIPFGNFWITIPLSIFVRGPLNSLSFYLIRKCRDWNSTVEYSSNKTLGLQIIRTFLSLRYFYTLSLYLVSAFLFALTYLFQLPYRSNYYNVSKIYEKKPSVNDEWLYYWYYIAFVAFLYSTQHLVFQRNRLKFEYGVSKIRPENSLWRNTPILIVNAFILNAITFILAPLIYIVARKLIYKLNILFFLIMGLDTKPLSLGITLRNLKYTSFFSANVYFAWEVLNHVYEVYATIGCLDDSKPISTYSSDPLNTLLSGVRNVDPECQLSRLSAFQEFAYIATSNDPSAIKLRHAIYNAHSKVGYLWLAILDECSLVIKEYTLRVNFRTSSDITALKKSLLGLKDELNTTANTEEIFGNSFSSGNDFNGRLLNGGRLQNYDDVFKPPNQTKYEDNSSYIIKVLEKKFPFIVKGAKSFLLQLEREESSTSKTIIGKAKSQARHLSQIYEFYRERFLSTEFGILFRITIRRDTESRVLNPVNYGNAVITLANLTMHAIEEDKKNTVTNTHIAEILNLLEKPIRASSNYAEVMPASVYVSKAQRSDPKLAKQHLIALLHDLTMSEFFQICVKYNHRLNDLVLLPRTFKLAKWAIDVAIAQQHKSHPQEGEVNRKAIY